MDTYDIIKQLTAKTDMVSGESLKDNFKALLPVVAVHQGWATENNWKFDFNPHEGFHDYAFEWTPNSIKWFVDDEEVYTQNESIVDDLNFSQKIMMNIWPAIWEDWVGVWDENDTPKHSYYDYVSYYSYTPGAGSYGTNNDFSFVWTDNFYQFNDYIWQDNSSGSFNGNLCSFSPKNSNIFNGHLILSLTDINENIDCNEITGDINIDNQLNVTDIVFIVNIILNNSHLDLNICQTLSADLNFDNQLNVIDIVKIVELIVSRG